MTRRLPAAVVDAADINSVLAPLRERGLKIVFTNGCFDLIHPGHVRYLTEARSMGDVLVVGLNSDDSVRRLEKGPGRPVMNEEERAEVLAGLKPVDYVVLFEEDTPLGLIERIVPDVLVKGGDWPVEKIVGREIVLDAGGSVRSIPLVEGKSTTGIVERVRKTFSEAE